MEVNDYFVIAMFLTFIGLLFTGFPVAWVLGGVSVLFTAIAIISDTYFDTMIGLDYITLGMAVNRIYKYMDNWVLVALPMFIFMGLMLDRSGDSGKNDEIHAGAFRQSPWRSGRYSDPDWNHSCRIDRNYRRIRGPVGAFIPSGHDAAGI